MRKAKSVMMTRQKGQLYRFFVFLLFWGVGQAAVPVPATPISLPPGTPRNSARVQVLTTALGCKAAVLGHVV